MTREEWMLEVLASDLAKETKARLIEWYPHLDATVPALVERETLDVRKRAAARSARAKVEEDWTQLARALCETLEERTTSWKRRQKFRELREDPALEDDDFARLQARRLAGEVSRRRAG